jgi:hypothetical protein
MLHEYVSSIVGAGDINAYKADTLGQCRAMPPSSYYHISSGESCRK